MSKKLKDIIKQNAEPARGKSGTNPMDPWGAKAQIEEASETELLHRFLKSRGINPDFIPKDTKIAHSKSGEFLKWRRDHEFDESLTVQHTPFEKRQHLLKKSVHMNKVVGSDVSSDGLHKEEIEILEATDKADTLTFDIPLMIRMLELAREDVKDDMELHRITERLIEIRSKGVLTMDDYDFIAGIKKLKEELEELAEGRMKDIATDAAETKRLNKMTTLQKFRADSAAREKKHADIEKNSGGMTSAIDRLEKHLDRNKQPEKSGIYKKNEFNIGEEVEQIDELKLSTLSSYKDKSTASLKNAQANRDAAETGKDMSKGFADLHAKSDAIAKKRVKGLKGYLQRKIGMKPTSEDVFQDPQAATQTVFDGGNNTDDCSCEKKRQMSKSARMIKSLYKHLNMKEETYDHEKDDKSTQVKGKNPKLITPEENSNFSEKKPDARAILSGGKTLTGQTRDNVEIDPLLTNRPSSPDTFEKPVGKKDK